MRDQWATCGTVPAGLSCASRMQRVSRRAVPFCMCARQSARSRAPEGIRRLARDGRAVARMWRPSIGPRGPCVMCGAVAPRGRRATPEERRVWVFPLPLIRIGTRQKHCLSMTGRCSTRQETPRHNARQRFGARGSRVAQCPITQCSITQRPRQRLKHATYCTALHYLNNFRCFCSEKWGATLNSFMLVALRSVQYCTRSCDGPCGGLATKLTANPGPAAPWPRRPRASPCRAACKAAFETATGVRPMTDGPLG